MSMFSHARGLDKKKPKSDPNSTYNRYLGAMAGQGAQSQQETDDYLTRARGFDAGAAVNTYAQGAWQSMKPELDQTLAGLGDSAVGAGRFDSGLFDRDRGRVVNQALSSLNASVAQQSLGAAGLQQQNTAQLGQFADNSTNRYFDAMTGQLDRETAEKNAAKDRKASIWGGALGAVGSIAGGLAGRR